MLFGQSFSDYANSAGDHSQFSDQWGRRITPHFGVSVLSSDGTSGRKLEYPVETGIISEKTSETVRGILEKVVSEGSGRNARIEGCTVGGQDGYFPDFAKKCQPVYFFLSWFYACGRSTDPGALHYT